MFHGVTQEKVTTSYNAIENKGANTISVVIYQDFHWTKRALWFVDSWSRAPDQIQMYPDRDTIAQLLPARRIQRHVISAWLT